MEEIWKDIAGYEGIYMVSNLGRVKRLERKIVTANGSNVLLKEVILSNKRIVIGRGNKYGYIKHRLTKNGVSKNVFAHKIVAEAFLENPRHKKQVDHIDGNSLNNNVKNLKWVSQSENNSNKISIERHKKSMLEYYKKNCLWFCGKTLKRYCEEKNICYSVVLDRIKKKGWSLEDAITKPMRKSNFFRRVS